MTTVSDLRARRDALTAEHRKLKQRLAVAKREARGTGKFLPAVEFNNTEARLIFLGLEIEKVNRSITKSRGPDSFEYRFMKAAKEILDAETFCRISAAADTAPTLKEKA